MNARKFTYSLVALLALTGILGSCSDEGLPLYNQKKGMLSFNASETANKTFSFMSRGRAVMQDTVWFTLDLIGPSVDYDRYYELEQIIPKDSVTQDNVPKPTDAPKTITAEAGVHYLAFDSPEAKKLQRFPANAIRTKVPIVLLRDTSLKTKEVTLNFKLKVSDDFDLGYKEYQTRTIKFSDKLMKPNLWVPHFFGTYGPEKHMFMIEATKDSWDDDYLKKLGAIIQYGSPTIDMVRQAYVQNLVTRLARMLEKENEARKARGEDVLREKDGTPVAFKTWG